MNLKRRSISVICLALVTVMLLPLLFSCKKGDGGNETTGNVNSDRLYLDDLGEFDFGGYEYNVLSITSEEGTYTKFDVDEITSAVLDNSIFYRNREIEERFNVKFIASDDTYPKCYEKLTMQCETGTNDFDMIMLVNRHAYAAAITGYVYPVEKLPHLNLTKDYYLKDANEMMTLGGKQFLAYSDESLYTFQRATVIAFNKTMAANLKIEGLYDTVKNNEWTFEKLFEYAKQGVKLDGEGNVEVYGFHGHGDYVFSSFIVAAGETYVEKQNNTLKFTAGSNEKIDTIANMELGYFKDGTMGYNFDYKNMNDYVQTFKDEQTLFHGTVIGKLLLLKDLTWDFGALPYPKYDMEQDGYKSRVVDAWLHVVPSSNPDPTRTSVILEALASGSSKWVFPAYYENSIQGRTLRDPESVEMLEIVRSTRVFDWGGITWSESIRAPIEKQVFDNQSMSVATVCQSQARVVSGLIKEANEGVKKLIEEFGQ
ncbi:MAG: extracellular solute-binding protein [Clostridia bacterium]|nr:extracellular solute-binding protein [Clostridia bacterium]